MLSSYCMCVYDLASVCRSRKCRHRTHGTSPCMLRCNRTLFLYCGTVYLFLPVQILCYRLGSHMQTCCTINIIITLFKAHHCVCMFVCKCPYFKSFKCNTSLYFIHVTPWGAQKVLSCILNMCMFVCKCSYFKSSKRNTSLYFIHVTPWGAQKVLSWISNMCTSRLLRNVEVIRYLWIMLVLFITWK